MDPKDKLEKTEKLGSWGNKEGQATFPQDWFKGQGRDAVDGLTRCKWVLSVSGHEPAELPVLSPGCLESQTKESCICQKAIPFEELEIWDVPKSRGHQRDKTEACSTQPASSSGFVIHPLILPVSTWHLNIQALYLFTFCSCSTLFPKPCLC